MLTAQKAKDLAVELRKAGLKVYVETPREQDSFGLPDWHRVVRNLEIQVPGMDQDGFD